MTYVIIGNGIAGITAAEILRAEDAAADITVIADDPFPVYYRPALKDYLAGRVREDKLWARQKNFYEEYQIRFLSERVIGIQVGQHTVQLQSGQQVGYQRLLLASGASASTLACPGLDLQGVTTLRTIADYQQVLAQLPSVRHVVVTGSGTLALETIETLRHRGLQVTHLLRRCLLWSEVLDETASDLVVQQEQRDGVEVRFEEEIVEIQGRQGRVSAVVTTAGARISCEMVIIAIGVDPITGFIRSSGIPCGRGVRVDGAMRSSAPDIYAAGDVVETTDAQTGRVRVLGQWYPAMQQARAAAFSMLDLLDIDAAAATSPIQSSAFYNATFLYGLDFAAVGPATMPKDSQGYQEIVADPQPRTYRKVLLKNGVPVGMLSLGNRKQALALKRAIDHRVNLASIAGRLFVPDFNLTQWLDAQGVPPPIIGIRRKGDAASMKAAAPACAAPTVAELAQAKPVMAALIPVARHTLPTLTETVLSQTKVMTVGRLPGAYLLLDHHSISRRHAELRYVGGQYILHDLGSTNGTCVNDRQLPQNGAVALKSGDRVSFGGNGIAFTFQLRAVSAAAPQEQIITSSSAGALTLHSMKTGFFDPQQVLQMTKSAQPILNADGSLLLPGAKSAIPASLVAQLDGVGQGRGALVVVSEDGNTQVYPLAPTRRVTIGRDRKNEIVLADPASSRRHAEVFHETGGFTIIDAGSSNGLSINHVNINNPYRLSHGDIITIGGTGIYFLAPGTSTASGAPAASNKKARVQHDPRHAVAANIKGHAAQNMAQKVCPGCSTVNIPVARFCSKCGTPL